MPEDIHSFLEDVTGESHLRVEADLGDGFVRLRSAEAERRQAKHDIRSSEDIVIEMLRNARDAHASNIYVATGREGTMRRIVMIDDGDGLPESMFERIFEARVTSKLDTMHMDLWGVHGRGMALYAVKVNAKDARVVTSKVCGGSSFSVVTDTAQLGEKRDQSSEPVFLVDDSGTVTVRGPRNINRTVCEFAYIERQCCNVYFGSFAEIAATLWRFGREHVPSSTIAFCNDPETIDVCKRLSLATTPDEFATLSASLGLPLSERTARRVMDGSIRPLPAVSDLVQPLKPGQVHRLDAKAPDSPSGHSAAHDEGDGDPKALLSALSHDARGLCFSSEDREAFLRGVERAFQQLASSYYLDGGVVPHVRFRRDRIDVTIPIVKQD